MRAFLATLDFILRFLFFLTVPFLLTFLAAFFSVTAALVNFGLMMGVFALRGVALRGVSRFPFLRKVFRRSLRFEAYYRDRKPRPFIYYLFYPLLAPYWLVHKDAREELIIFRGYTVFGLFVLASVAAFQYLRLWRPEIPFSTFLGVMQWNFLIETVVMLAFLMPIATSVVSMTVRKQRKRLALLLCAAAASMTLAVVALRRQAQRHHDVVAFSTQMRLRARTGAAPPAATTALVAALRAAWASPGGLGTLGRHGLVEGDALEAAHAQLETFYREDEAHAFSLIAWPEDRPRVLILFFWVKSMKQGPLWVAMQRRGGLITHKDPLPDDVLEAMKALSPR